jgi:hypothetical protein
VSIKVYLSMHTHDYREGGCNTLRKLEIPREHYDPPRLQQVSSSPPSASLLTSSQPDLGAEQLSAHLTLPASLVGWLETLETEQLHEGKSI